MIPVTMACGPIVSTMQRSPALALEQPVVIGRPESVAPDIETVTFASDIDLTVAKPMEWPEPPFGVKSSASMSPALLMSLTFKASHLQFHRASSHEGESLLPDCEVPADTLAWPAHVDSVGNADGRVDVCGR